MVSALITIHVTNHLMKFLKILALSVALLATVQAVQQPSAHTKGTPIGKPTGPLKPGEYWWKPQLSPSGPLMVLVSIPQQTMHVYRNGILIGRSTVSTGSKGHATPGGVFSILEKKQEHYSKKYNNAPMPNMQRLTWTGIAMHSGNLPGYPASHGCIRLPYDFSQLLFSETSKVARSGPRRAPVDDRDQQGPQRSCREDRGAPPNQPGVCEQGLRHHRTGHDCHHYRSTGRAEPRQCRDSRRIAGATGLKSRVCSLRLPPRSRSPFLRGQVPRWRTVLDIIFRCAQETHRRVRGRDA